MEWEKYSSKGEKLVSMERHVNKPVEMHSNEVQDGFMGEKSLKPQEVADDDIDVEKVDNGEAINEEPNANGFHHGENGHSDQKEKETFFVEEKVIGDSAPAPDKSILRLKSSRRNSTSSRSSSVSSAPSVKPQTPSALQMEVSMDDTEKDHMEPLVMEGTAEDLEVSMYGSHCDADNEGNSVTIDYEAVKPKYVYDDEEEDEEEEEDDEEEEEEDDDDDDDASEDSWEQLYVHEVAERKAKTTKSTKVVKPQKLPPKPKPVMKATPRPKVTPRSKSLKLKGSKQSPKVSKNTAEKSSNNTDKNSDSNSLSKDDSVTDDLMIKTSRSPSKRPKSTPSKQDNGEETDEKSDAEHVPRRSSRPRQTPQKYNSSVYVDSNWDFSGVADERLNNSDAAFGTNIRSVRGRRSLRKSRNISTLNASLHDESSPWDSDFKVLTPCGDGLSVHADPVGDNIDSSTPLKRKAIDDDNEDDDDKRGQKKMCVETTDMENSASSSFFSVITSPILMLKNKLRGSSVSSSTPLPTQEQKNNDASEMESMLSANENDDGVPVDAGAISAEQPAVETQQESQKWCTIM